MTAHFIRAEFLGLLAESVSFQGQHGHLFQLFKDLLLHFIAHSVHVVYLLVEPINFLEVYVDFFYGGVQDLELLLEVFCLVLEENRATLVLHQPVLRLV